MTVSKVVNVVFREVDICVPCASACRTSLTSGVRLFSWDWSPFENLLAFGADLARELLGQRRQSALPTGRVRWRVDQLLHRRQVQCVQTQQFRLPPQHCRCFLGDVKCRARQTAGSGVCLRVAGSRLDRGSSFKQAEDAAGLRRFGGGGLSRLRREAHRARAKQVLGLRIPLVPHLNRMAQFRPLLRLEDCGIKLSRYFTLRGLA